MISTSQLIRLWYKWIYETLFAARVVVANDPADRCNPSPNSPCRTHSYSRTLLQAHHVASNTDHSTHTPPPHLPQSQRREWKPLLMLPCPSYPLLNAASLAVSFTPSNGTLVFSLRGVHTISGYAGLSVGLVVDEIKKYEFPLDACNLGVPALCPPREGVVDIAHTNWTVQSVVISYLDLYARENVTFRLGVGIYGEDERLHSTCVQTVLRSEASDGEGEGAGLEGGASSNATASDGGSESYKGTADEDGKGDGDSSDSTPSDGGASPDGQAQTQDYGTHKLQAACYLPL